MSIWDVPERILALLHSGARALETLLGRLHTEAALRARLGERAEPPSDQLVLDLRDERPARERALGGSVAPPPPEGPERDAAYRNRIRSLLAENRALLDRAEGS